jgi:hypothetical protein
LADARLCRVGHDEGADGGMSERTFTPIPEPIERDPVHGDTYRHPSFGTIWASRYQGGGRRPMFGSKILHDGGGRVAVEIHAADYKRNLHNDWIHPRNPALVRIEMTEAQWAHFISSPNSQATPCTIVEMRDGDIARVEEPPFFEIVDQFEMELHAKLDKTRIEAERLLAKIDAMLAGKTISRTALGELRSSVSRTLEHLPGNLEFFRTEFEQAMEATVEEARLDIETHINNSIKHLGLETARALVGLPERQSALTAVTTRQDDNA